MIFGDERRYLQIIINFLSNALKFSPKDSQIKINLKVNELIEKYEDKSAKNYKIKLRNSCIVGSGLTLGSLIDRKSTHYINYDICI